MQYGTVVAANQTRSLVAFRIKLGGRHMYTVAELVDGWTPEVGERVGGEFNCIGGTELVCADGTKASVRISHCGCGIDLVEEMLR